MRPVHAARPARSLLGLLVAPVAVVISAVLLFLRMHYQPPEVPPYAVSFEHGAGTDSPAKADDRFELELAPASPVRGAVAARAFLVRGDHLRPWDAPFQVTREGVVRIAGPVGSLFAGVPGGRWDVAVAVGRPELLPTAPSDVLSRRDGRRATGPAGWRLVVAPVWIEGGSGPPADQR